MGKIIIRNEARKKIWAGVKKLNDTVSLTIGPKGKNIIIDNDNGSPLITNDGVTITKNVVLDDKYEQLGCDIVKQASLKTNDEVGDGTTSAVVLAAAIVKNAFAEIENGSDPNEIKDGLLYTAKHLINEIELQSKPCETYDDLLSVATNSCANANDGELVATAFARVGKNGLVTVTENQTGETNLTFTEGLNLEFDLMSPYFCDNIEKGETVYTDAKILMYDGKINSIKEVLHILEWCVKNSAPLVLMADDFSAEIINALLLNRVKSGLRVVAVKYGIWADGKTAIMGDISAVTNATIINEKNDLTLATATPKHFGNCDKIIVGLTETIIFAGGNPTKKTSDKEVAYETAAQINGGEKVQTATQINGGEKAQTAAQICSGEKAQIAAQIDKAKIKTKQQKALQDHILRLKSGLKNATDDYTKNRLKERISKLENGIAIISVGCATAAETKERKLRIEDAVNATASALRSGVVVGGGMSYYNLVNKINKNSMGAKILCESLPSVIKAIYKNANI
ncbi:MAG: hypothetical protein LBQ05_00940, partial [Christensenellaceae bacterium]|nr:hypothetical protein [Christensenellaceae bacterium]